MALASDCRRLRSMYTRVFSGPGPPVPQLVIPETSMTLGRDLGSWCLVVKGQCLVYMCVHAYIHPNKHTYQYHLHTAVATDCKALCLGHKGLQAHTIVVLKEQIVGSNALGLQGRFGCVDQARVKGSRCGSHIVVASKSAEVEQASDSVDRGRGGGQGVDALECAQNERCLCAVG